MNVCDALLEILAEHGVKHIFGIPGDAINELLEAIRKQDKIKFIHVMHEETGAFAAAAQAKLSGELAVCCGTAGPGAIHLLNGLYDAKMDKAPVLAITGQVETSLIGTAYQQEVNLLSLFSDATVFNECVIHPEQMPELALLACQTAIAKKGVAHLNIPSNISSQKLGRFSLNKQAIHAGISRIVPCKDDIWSAAEIINKAVKPLILAGIGARGAIRELVQLAEHIKAPVIKALRGKDLLPDEHPLTLGGLGALGTEPSVKAMKDCDLLIMIGTDFPYHDYYPDKKIPVVQIDNDPTQIGRRHHTSHSLVGDAKLTLNELIPLLQGNRNDGFLIYYQKFMQKWLRKMEGTEANDNDLIHPQSLARSISDQANEDAIICCDTGAVTVWGARNFRLRGIQRFTLSGDLASMAYALPASIGASLRYPGRQVIALCGDGGFAMLMCDFATAVKYRLPVKIFIFNNSKLGLIQMEQEAGAGLPEYETDLNNPDYALYAHICGGEGITIKSNAELKEGVRRALSSENPCIINVSVNPEELTMPPEIKPGEAINYMKAKVKEYFIKH